MSLIGTLFGRPKPRQRGNRARDARHWQEAADHYRAHLATAPDDFAIWVQLGHMLTEAGELHAADDAYACAAALSGQDADLRLCWGHSRKGAGDLERARQLYRASLAADPGSAALGELSAWDQPRDPSPPNDAPHEGERHHDPPSPPRHACDVRALSLKPLGEAAGRQAAMFVTHSATGAIKPHVLPYVEALARQGIDVLLIVVADRPVTIAPPLQAAAAGILIRENAGYDFAAWAHAFALYPDLFGASVLYLVNDSLIGPVDAGTCRPSSWASSRGCSRRSVSSASSRMCGSSTTRIG